MLLFSRLYQKRLMADIERWHGAGFVTGAGRQAILAELRSGKAGLGIAGLFGLMGAIILCCAAMTFVAANWDGMANVARLGVLIGSLWLAYGIAWVLFSKGYNAFAQAASLLGCGIFGASIMLIAQIYHMQGHPPDAVLLWALGTILAAGLLRSQVCGWLAFGLITLWSCWVITLNEILSSFDAGHSSILQLHWPFIVVWFGLTVLSVWQSWAGGRHMSGVSLVIWILFASNWVDESHWLFFCAALVGLAISYYMLTNQQSGWRALVHWDAVFNYAGLIFALTIFFIYSWWFRGGSYAIIFAFIVLALAISLIIVARKLGLRISEFIGYGLFATLIIYLYFKTLGTLLGTAGFFAGAGLLLIILAVVITKLSRSLSDISVDTAVDASAKGEES